MKYSAPVLLATPIVIVGLTGSGMAIMDQYVPSFQYPVGLDYVSVRGIIAAGIFASLFITSKLVSQK